MNTREVYRNRSVGAGKAWLPWDGRDRWATDLQNIRRWQALNLQGMAGVRLAKCWERCVAGLGGGTGFGCCGTKKPDAPAEHPACFNSRVRRSVAGPVPPP